MYYIVSKVCEYLYSYLLPFFSCSFTEVEVGEISAIDTVLKADKKRLQLLEEEKKLNDELEAGDDSNTERLKQVMVIVFVPVACICCELGI